MGLIRTEGSDCCGLKQSASRVVGTNERCSLRFMDHALGEIVHVNDPLTLEREVIGRLRPFGGTEGYRRIVVPSESLRLHWIRRIMASKKATIGIEVCTHQRLAENILEGRALTFVNRRAWLAEVVRDVAAAEPTLKHVLDGLSDGYGLVVRQVFELLDAGLTDAHSCAVAERARALTGVPGVATGVAPRIAALLRVACKVDVVARAAGVSATPILLDVVTDAVRCAQDARGRVDGSIFVGFADATGRLADFIAACQRHAGACVALDCPPNPTDTANVEPGVAFASAFRSRFETLSHRTVGRLRSTERVVHIESVDPFAEAKQVAERCAVLIASGTPPESIGVVARHLAPWGNPISEAFRERGVPFSGLGATKVGARVHRRANAAATLLERRERATVAVWLDACGVDRHDPLRLAMDCRGARTLTDVSSMDAGPIQTNVVRGVVRGSDGPRVEKVIIPQQVLSRAIRRCRSLCDVFANWPERASAAVYRRLTSKVLGEHLDFQSISMATEAALEAFGSVPNEVGLSAAGAVRLVNSSLRSAGSSPLGGAGGGVAVLSATEARSRTFDALFLVGLNRGEFPRTVSEDPLFPDAARRVFRDVLPDLRSRMDGLLEERFLFAQLLNSSPVIQLSNSRLGRDGSVNHSSPLLVEMQLAERVVSLNETATKHHRVAWREAIHRGRQGADVSEVLALVGRSHLVEKRTVGTSDVGAEFGYIGPVRSDLDPRKRVRYVTFIEQVARCPWSAFLSRMLGVGERPGSSPELPSISNHLVGLTVHQVVERLVDDAVDETRAETSLKQPWPDPETLGRWAAEEAYDVLRRQGIMLRGFEHALVPPVLESLGLIRSMDEPLECVTGGEVEVSWTPTVGPTIRARADRIERRDGTNLVTDLKLGKPPTAHKKESTRREKTVAAVRRGEMLQGPLYARSVEGSMGRYLYVNPVLEVPQREFTFSADDPETGEAMDRILSEVNDALRLGTMFPRVSEATRDKKPRACGSCRVREACAVEDSGVRNAVMNAAIGRTESDEGRAFSGLWFRGSAR